jgi:hypothetical protein
LFSGNAYAEIKRKVLESDINNAWNIDGKFIKPECFENNWITEGPKSKEFLKKNACRLKRYSVFGKQKFTKT